MRSTDEELLEIGLALAGALAHAHARGVIHRDIKPQNVLVPDPADAGHAAGASSRAAKLTDFGGASLAGEDALTRTGDVLGTLAYMAPEQTEGRRPARQADLYSLALVIYEALARRQPRARRHAGGRPRGASAARSSRCSAGAADLPRELTRALDRALAPAPRDRGTLAELRLAFAEALERGSRRARAGARARHRAPRLGEPACSAPRRARSAARR